MSESTIALRDATVQDIQLDLIRRTQFNAMDGRQVYASLIAHRHLWKAALLDRPGFANYQKPRDLLTMGLIKLRDLSANLWNADTVYVLTDSHDRAAELRRLIEAEDWAGEVRVHADQDEIGDALGTPAESGGW